MKTTKMLAILVFALGLTGEVANADFTFGTPTNLGPTVSYEVVTKDGVVKRIESPGQLPDPSHIEELREPFVRLEIITGTDSIGGIMKLADSRRCKLVKTDYWLI